MNQYEAKDPINQVISGVKQFQDQIYPEKEELFKSLARKQDPKILFITCSDSRIDPSLITQTEPGSLFLLHNAGNIVPPHGTPYGGTAASIEYALTVLNVEHIILCGHSFCGAMGALLDDKIRNNAPPSIKQWISYAEATRAIIEVETVNLSQDEKLHRCVERNVQVQMRHLRTFPTIAAKLSSGELKIHGWVYHIETGEIDVYQPETDVFIPFSQAYADSLAALGSPCS